MKGCYKPSAVAAQCEVDTVVQCSGPPMRVEETTTITYYVLLFYSLLHLLKSYCNEEILTLTHLGNFNGKHSNQNHFNLIQTIF